MSSYDLYNPKPQATKLLKSTLIITYKLQVKQQILYLKFANLGLISTFATDLA